MSKNAPWFWSVVKDCPVYDNKDIADQILTELPLFVKIQCMSHVLIFHVITKMAEIIGLAFASCYRVSNEIYVCFSVLVSFVLIVVYCLFICQGYSTPPPMEFMDKTGLLQPTGKHNKVWTVCKIMCSIFTLSKVSKDLPSHHELPAHALLAIDLAGRCDYRMLRMLNW